MGILSMRLVAWLLDIAVVRRQPQTTFEMRFSGRCAYKARAP